MTHQFFTGFWLARELRRLNCPQATLAHFVGVSQPLVSTFLAGKKGLSSDVQTEIFRFLHFAEDLIASTEAPVDFSNIDGLQRLWDRFVERERAENLIRLASERAPSESK